MADGYRVEDVEQTPQGWRVRTLLMGPHRVRIAFPPGPRRRGSGRVVQILHPRAENPRCNARLNPYEVQFVARHGGPKDTRVYHYPTKEEARAAADRMRREFFPSGEYFTPTIRKLANPLSSVLSAAVAGVGAGVGLAAGQELYAHLRGKKEKASSANPTQLVRKSLARRLEEAAAAQGRVLTWSLGPAGAYVYRLDGRVVTPGEAADALGVKWGRRNPKPGDTIDWMESMVSELVEDYNSKRRAGFSHEKAVSETLKGSTAGKGARAEFFRRIGRGNNPDAGRSYMAFPRHETKHGPGVGGSGMIVVDRWGIYEGTAASPYGKYMGEYEQRGSELVKPGGRSGATSIPTSRVRFWNPADKEDLRLRAAAALDATHAIGERGPRTFQARDSLARWLDGESVTKREVMAAIRWLEKQMPRLTDAFREGLRGMRSTKETTFNPETLIARPTLTDRKVYTLTDARGHYFMTGTKEQIEKGVREGLSPGTRVRFESNPRGASGQFSSSGKPTATIVQTAKKEGPLSGNYYVLKMGGREIGGDSAERLARYARSQGYVVQRNPNGNGSAAAKAAYKDFHGREPSEVLDMHEKLLARGDYFALGTLTGLWLKPPPKGKDPNGWPKAEIWFDEKDGVKVAAADETGRQLYFIGGNQALPLDALRERGLDVSKRFIPLGNIYAIGYLSEKVFDGYETSEYDHAFGEESGVVPVGFYDRETERILLAGGSYRIAQVETQLGASPGIVD